MQDFTKEQLELRQLADECFDEALQRLLEGNLKQALDLALRARDIYEEIDDKSQLAAALNRLAIIYEEMGNSSLALECFMDALELAVGREDYPIEAKLYNNLGSKCMHVKAYDKALNYFRLANESFQKALQINPDIGEYAFRLVLEMNFCSIYLNTGDYEHARRHLDRARKNLEMDVDSDLRFSFMCFESLALWKIGDKEEAENRIDTIVEKAKTTEYTTDYLEVMQDLLELLKNKKDYTRLETVLNLMENRLTKDVSVYIKSEVLKQWIEFYKVTGDTEKYQAACVKYYELSKLKAEEDFKKGADTIELQEKVRHAAKQKKHTDEIIYRDPLTGIGNRNLMLEDSAVYIERSVKNVTPIAIGLIDIDFFKECNDTYGHIVGDNCLKKVASIIEEAVSDYGKVYRYGGDEFLLLLPKIQEKEIEELGKSIREKLAEAQIPNEKSSVSEYVTVSQGYTKAYAEEGDTIETMVMLVDRVLYSAKHKGRDNFIYTGYNEVIDKI